MDEDEPEEEQFDGYAIPGGAQGGNTGGAGGRQPPRGGNVAGGDDLGDSSSSSSDSDESDASPPDLRDFLGSCKQYWSREKKDKYDRRYAALNKFIQECHKAKKSSQRPKKPEKLGVDPFTGDPKDTQCFVHDVNIKLDYIRDSLVKEIDKVSLVIPLLRDTAKEWYNAIHPHINKDVAKRRGIKFDPKNELRTWEGFCKRLEGSFGGHSDRNRALREWSQLFMKDGKVDRFIDELVRLVAVLGYSGEFVKDRVRMGMTDVLNAAWSMKNPHPVAYMDYVDQLRHTGHQLEDASNFRIQVPKEPHSSQCAKSDDRHTSERKGHRKEQKALGSRQQKPHNRAQGFTKPAETEHTKMQRNVPQTLIDKRKRLNQCSRCGQDGHYWAKCPSAAPLVASSHIRQKQSAGEAGHETTQVPKSRHIEAAPKPAVKQVVAELRGSPPPDLDILEVDTDMDD